MDSTTRQQVVADLFHGIGYHEAYQRYDFTYFEPTFGVESCKNHCNDRQSFYQPGWTNTLGDAWGESNSQSFFSTRYLSNRYITHHGNGDGSGDTLGSFGRGSQSKLYAKNICWNVK